MVNTAEKRRTASRVSRLWAGAGVTPLDIGDIEWRVEAARTYHTPDVIFDVEDCFSRRPEIEHLCLRRLEEDVLALRRAPECPTEFACPAAGCV